MRRLVLISLVALLGGCGGSSDAPPRATGKASTLTLTHDADGDGPRPAVTASLRCPAAADSDRACAELARLTAADFAPTPARTACTQLFAGPEQATISGTLRGARVDARFSRDNGCEIQRYARVAPLLDAALGAGAGVA